MWCAETIELSTNATNVIAMYNFDNYNTDVSNTLCFTIYYVKFTKLVLYYNTEDKQRTVKADLNVKFRF